MSGYLQRLAARAHTPREGIRPVLQPLFTAPQLEPVPAGLTLEAETRPARAGTPRLRQPVRKAGPEPDSVAADSIQSDPILTEPIKSDPIRMDLIKPNPIAADPTKSDPIRTDLIKPNPVASDSTKPNQTLPLRAPVPSPPEDSLERRIYLPLFAEVPPRKAPASAVFPTGDSESIRSVDAGVSDQWPTVTKETTSETRLEAQAEFRPAGFPIRAHPASSRLSTERRSERRTAPGRPPFTTPEPDEIQIHIGRIEISAVPLATAPPVRKPERKSLNLDDYLTRSR